ncbi:50S ribosomal protein L25 [Desulfococcus sp.]|uniref:50S ribosomal protein L25 n=1 Tax=Desulfococcus sp. TaxID=2025834 RepID=UPI0035940A4D
MELIELKANVRTERKKGPSRRLRADGRIPAVLYGPGAETIALSIDTTELDKAIKSRTGSQAFFNMTIEGGDISTKTAMIKHLQIHPVTRHMIHADFYEIAMDRKIRAMAPVTVTGKCIGVENGGMLQIIRRELEVLCFPNQMPEEIEIDITELDMGDSVHIQDIVTEEGIEFPHDANFTVLTILSGRPEEAGEGAGAEEAAGGSEAGE